MKTSSIFLSILVLLIIACEEKDAPVLEGDIHGRVSLIDGYGYSLTDKSGVQVRLTGENTELETTTDRDGRYIFQDIPFGNYHINLIRENFIAYSRNISFGHLGGTAPTVTDLVIYGIPEFRYGIDSMIYDGSAHFNIYMHTIGATKAFTYSLIYVHFFFSRSPDVSCDNYENSFVDVLPHNDNMDLYWMFWYGYYNFLKDYSDTVYCRVYPQTNCNYLWYTPDAGPHPIYPETLGPPSGVFSFTVEGITRTDPDF
jgi:hypothetical protein